MLQVSVQTIQRWADSGQLTAWKTLGGHRRISLSSLARVLAQRPMHASTEPPLCNPAPVLKTCTLLLVDDHAEDRALMAYTLERILPRAKVVECADGIAALLCFHDVAPDIVITDLMMPGINGIAMAQRLLCLPDRPRRILAVTSWRREELEPLGHIPDDVAILRKPVAPERLAELLQDALAAPEGHEAIRPTA